MLSSDYCMGNGTLTRLEAPNSGAVWLTLSLSASLVEGGVVDLAEIEQGFLDGAAAGHAAAFHDAPVAVLLAVLESFVGAQKHELALKIRRTPGACP